MKGLDHFTRNLDWNLLKYFIQIAQRGGIGAAADSLNLSQPSVSASLRRLEDRLGVQLCVRTRKGVVLTGAGEALLQVCDVILSRLSSAPETLRAISGDLGGSVLVKTISHVFSPALDAGVAMFKARYPDVELVLESGHGDRIVEALLNGDTAIAVGFDEGLRPELDRALLMTERQLVYCGPTHRLAGSSVSHPSELEGEPFVVLSEGEPPTLRTFRQANGLGRRIGGVADNVYEAAWLIGLGIGVGQLPEPLALTINPPLTALLAPEMAPALDIYLMWRPDLQSLAARRLVEIICEQVKTQA